MQRLHIEIETQSVKNRLQRYPPSAPSSAAAARSSRRRVRLRMRIAPCATNAGAAACRQADRKLSAIAVRTNASRRVHHSYRKTRNTGGVPADSQDDRRPCGMEGEFNRHIGERLGSKSSVSRVFFAAPQGVRESPISGAVNFT